MFQELNTAIAVIGIDIGKNSFHIVGLDQRGEDLWSQRTRTRRGDTALVVNVWFYRAGPGMVSE